MTDYNLLLADMKKQLEQVERAKTSREYKDRVKEMGQSVAAGIEKSMKVSEIIEKVGIDRLMELVEADRDGRCVVLPVKPGGTVRFARNPRAKRETVDAITIYADGRMNFGFHEIGIRTEWVDRWNEDDADNYVAVDDCEET